MKPSNIYTNFKNLTSPSISIITVVYNGGNVIEKTIQSIVNQTYKNIEYIIIDGNSTDNTLDVIKKYQNNISYWISEPDSGLYDAMNKGLKIAHADYVLFINAGDELYAPETIEKIFNASDFTIKKDNITSQSPFPDVFFGETEMIDETGKSIGLRRLKPDKNLNWKHLKNGMLVSHQSVVVKKSIAKKYNISYKYAADYDWVICALQKAQQTINTNIIISKFLDGGRTKQTIIPGLKERFKIMCKHYGFLTTFFQHFKIGIRFFIFVIRYKRF